MKFTRELLDEILREGGASVLGEYKLYNQRMRVRFRCSCGAEAFKKFEMLNVYKLPYCEACSSVKVLERCKKTFMEKYGVDCSWTIKNGQKTNCRITSHYCLCWFYHYQYRIT